MITQMRHVLQVIDLQRVEIDPNRVSRKNPDWTVVGREEVDRSLSVGEMVIVSQPDSDGSDFISSGVVAEVNEEYGLYYLDVDWAGFHVPISQPVRPKLANSTVELPSSNTSSGSARDVHLGMAVAA